MHVAKVSKKYMTRSGTRESVSYLLRRTFREDGKVKHETLANLSTLPNDTIEVVRASLAGVALVPAVALEAEAHPAQHPRHRPVRDRMPPRGEFAGQVTRRLRGPHQRRHRISTGVGIDQCPQLISEPGIGLGQPLAATSGGTHPRLRFRDPLHLTDPAGDGVWMHPGSRSDRLDRTPTHLRGLHPEQQSSLALVKVRTQHRVPTRHGLRHTHAVGHSTTVEP